MFSSRTTILGLISIAVLGGTLYSVINHTYVDTSDPLLTNLPHPLQHQSIFARKSNIFNQLFIKKAWGWTSAAFVLLWVASPSEYRSVKSWMKWGVATAIWGTFVSWFFGPGLFQRVLVASGGECVVALPPSSSDDHPVILSLPAEYCYSRTIISPQTHPALFTTSFLANSNDGWTGQPKIFKGHDVSGHIFLLSFAALFLHDQLVPAWRLLATNRPTSPLYKTAVGVTSILLSLWILMCLTTSVYWHVPFEKLTGLGMDHVSFL